VLYSFSVLADVFGMDDIAHVYWKCIFPLHLLLPDFLLFQVVLRRLLCSTMLLFSQLQCAYSINAPVPPPTPLSANKTINLTIHILTK
jgi:hypothetical protein